MISIFLIYLLVAGAIIFFILLRPVLKKRAERGPAPQGLMKALTGAIITWLLLAVISGILFYRFLSAMLIR